jgi:hypothetical protein
LASAGYTETDNAGQHHLYIESLTTKQRIQRLLPLIVKEMATSILGNRSIPKPLFIFPFTFRLRPPPSFYPSSSLISAFYSFYHYSMPRPPYPLALFSLFPYRNNERAKRAVAHPDNIYYVSMSPDSIEALNVGFHIRGKSSTTLAILGRGIKADIYLEGSSIIKVQYSFEIDLDTGIIIFFDRSYGYTTQVSGENAKPFEYKRI